MFKHLAKLFRRQSEPRLHKISSARSELDGIASAGEDEATSIRREALVRFMRLATSHLGDVEGHRIMEVMLASFDTHGSPSEALEEVALGNAGQKVGQWFVIQCDWKASEEVEWQVSDVASSFGIPERWSWGAGDEKARTVPAGLCDAANWAAPLGFEMLHLDLESDTYYAILIKRDDAESAYQTALSAGMKVLRTPEFELSHA